MTEKEFKNVCFDMFYVLYVRPSGEVDGTSCTRTKEHLTEEARQKLTKKAIELLRSIHPDLHYQNLRLAFYAIQSETLMFLLDSGDYVSVPPWAANPVGLACVFSGVPTDKRMANLIKGIWQSCGSKELPTLKAAEILLKWLDATKIWTLLRAKNTDGLVQLVFEPTLGNKRQIKWLPYGMSINNLAAVVINTGDLPNKKQAMTWARQLKKNEMGKKSGKDKDDWTLDL